MSANYYFIILKTFEKTGSLTSVRKILTIKMIALDYPTKTTYKNALKRITSVSIYKIST